MLTELSFHAIDLGPGKISWGFSDVDKLASAILNALPEQAMQLILQPDFPGTNEFVKLDSALSRPGYRELRANFVLLRPVATAFPSTVPGALFLTDVMLHLNTKLNQRLFQTNAKLQAAREAQKLKRAMQALRYLFRNGLLFQLFMRLRFRMPKWRFREVSMHGVSSGS